LNCEPNNEDLQQRNRDALALRALGQSTVPSTIALEKATNPFFRCNSAEIIQTLRQRGFTESGDEAVFAALRRWRDG
jgi:hydroxyacylglutathione hydrolase